MKPEIVLVISAFLGWILGAAINYLADVLPLYRKLAVSACPACHEQFGISNYLMNRPCPTCGRKASLRQQIFSTTTFLGFILIATYFIQSPIAILQGIVVFVFFVLVIIIDLEHHLILHTVSIIGALGLGVLGYFKHGLVNTLLGGVAGFVMMYILYLIGVWFGRLLSKKRGTPVEEGLGFGDVTLATVCGLLIGWPGIIASLFFGILLGGIVSMVIIGISLVRKQYTPFLAIPYGPFLAVAAFALWITSLP